MIVCARTVTGGQARSRERLARGFCGEMATRERGIGQLRQMTHVRTDIRCETVTSHFDYSTTKSQNKKLIARIHLYRPVCTFSMIPCLAASANDHCSCYGLRGPFCIVDT